MLTTGNVDAKMVHIVLMGNLFLSSDLNVNRVDTSKSSNMKKWKNESECLEMITRYFVILLNSSFWSTVFLVHRPILVMAMLLKILGTLFNLSSVSQHITWKYYVYYIKVILKVIALLSEVVFLEKYCFQNFPVDLTCG